MATATKTLRSLVAAATVNAAGTTTNGTTWNLTTALGGLMTAKIINGGSAPNVACDFVVQVSADGTSWKEFSRQTASKTLSVATEFTCTLPIGTMYARPVFVGNTGNDVSVEAYGHELTAVG